MPSTISGCCTKDFANRYANAGDSATSSIADAGARAFSVHSVYVPVSGPHTDPVTISPATKSPSPAPTIASPPAPTSGPSPAMEPASDIPPNGAFSMNRVHVAGTAVTGIFLSMALM
ncbi:hypothetical protein Acr_27g0003210 [Actinidia rufa]|uniref:Uncharacterized protein n=1 Tax=Actinidia rufa TaxID=165716 RepID=A0A7J0H672_9ERIC|nr:hypothetical protein Acr_27g0003210 [Actinidia rufa]